MRGAAVLRAGFLVFVAAALAVSLAGILLTGPVVVRVPRVDFDVEADPQRLRADVVRLCSDFGPRDAAHPDNLRRAADWIAAELRDAGLEVAFQEYEAGGQRFRNVIGRRAGSDPAAPIVIVGAHYDAYGELPGADDNASGVAVLLELARTLPATVRRGQTLVAFCTEEPPWFGTEDMGSFHYARTLRERGTEIHVMISLDMVGYYSDEPASQRFPFPGLGLMFPDRGNFVAVVGDLRAGPWIERVKRGMLTTRALPVESLRASPRWAPVDLSDHASFRRLGLPGVQVTDTAFLRYPHYHQAGDTPDRLDYARMARLVLALHGVLRDGDAS